MRVLVCSNNYSSPVNGPAIFTRLCLDLDKCGEEVDVVEVLTEDVTEQEDGVYRLDPKFSRCFPPLGMLLRNFDYFFAIKKIRKQKKVDVVLFVNAITGVLTGLYAKNDQFRVFGMINDDSSARPNHTKGISLYQLTRRWLFRQFERISFGAFQAVIVNSIHLQKVLISEYDQVINKLPVLYKAIDFTKIHYKQREIPPEATVKVLFVKTDFIRGGLELLIKALQHLKKYNFELIAIGPDETRHSYLHHLNESKLVKLELLGNQSREVVHQKMKRSHLFCVPAYQEALGVANIEALASGIPVVYTMVGGIPEVMDYGSNGWPCKKGDELALARAIEECLELRDARQQKSEAGRRYVEEKFSKKKMLKTLSGILSKGRGE